MPVIVVASASALINNDSPVIQGHNALRSIALRSGGEPRALSGGSCRPSMVAFWTGSSILEAVSALRYRRGKRLKGPRDALRPLLDGGPVTEVAFGSAQAFDDHALHEGQLAVVKRAE